MNARKSGWSLNDWAQVLVHDADLITDILFLVHVKQTYDSCTCLNYTTQPASWAACTCLNYAAQPENTCNVCSCIEYSCGGNPSTLYKIYAASLSFIVISIFAGIFLTSFLVFIVDEEPTKYLRDFLNNLGPLFFLFGFLSIATSQERLFRMLPGIPNQPLVVFSSIFFVLGSVPQFACQFVMIQSGFENNTTTIVSMVFTVYKVLTIFTYRVFKSCVDPDGTVITLETEEDEAPRATAGNSRVMVSSTPPLATAGYSTGMASMVGEA